LGLDSFLAEDSVGKEKPSLPRTALLLDPDGLLYLDKSSVESCLSCLPT
jgi:hypothetical protein